MNKRFRLSKIVRSSLVIGLAIGTVGLGYSAYKEAYVEKVSSIEEIVYEYSNEAQIVYSVDFNQNPIYDTSRLGEDTYYLSQYIKQVNMRYEDIFKGSIEQQTTSSYKIVAILRAYTMQLEDKMTIWEKEYELQPLKEVNSNDVEQKISEVVKVDLSSYEAFITDLNENEDISMPMELEIAVKGSKKLETTQGNVEIPIDGKLIIPMDSSYFMIEKQVPQPINEKQTETITSIIPPSTKIMVAESIGAFICLAGVILIILLVGDLEDQQKYQRKMNRLLRDYGSRLIEIQQLDTVHIIHSYELKSIEDLVKVADELEIPMMYHKQEEPLVAYFYAISGDTLYRFEFKYQEKSEENKLKTHYQDKE